MNNKTILIVIIVIFIIMKPIEPELDEGTKRFLQLKKVYEYRILPDEIHTELIGTNEDYIFKKYFKKTSVATPLGGLDQSQTIANPMTHSMPIDTFFTPQYSPINEFQVYIAKIPSASGTYKFGIFEAGNSLAFCTNAPDVSIFPDTPGWTTILEYEAGCTVNVGVPHFFRITDESLGISFFGDGTSLAFREYSVNAPGGVDCTSLKSNSLSSITSWSLSPTSANKNNAISAITEWAASC